MPKKSKPESDAAGAPAAAPASAGAAAAAAGEKEAKKKKKKAKSSASDLTAATGGDKDSASIGAGGPDAATGSNGKPKKAKKKDVKKTKPSSSEAASEKSEKTDKKKVPKKAKSLSKIPSISENGDGADVPKEGEKKKVPKKAKSLSKLPDDGNNSTAKKKKKKKETSTEKDKTKSKSKEQDKTEETEKQQKPQDEKEEPPPLKQEPPIEEEPVKEEPPKEEPVNEKPQVNPQEDASVEEDEEPEQHPSILSLLDKTADDMDQLHNSQIIEALPPIGEIVATSAEDDDVSDIAEVITEEVAAGGDPVMIDGQEIIYNPDDTDVCFDDRGHPGTKDWIGVIRECLVKFDGEEYSPPVYKAIKKRLKGRRFLIRTRRNERTSWREASKPEVIELFGECFNEERRRKNEGITSDDSEVDDSLQNSAAQSEESLSVGIIMQDKTKGNQTPTKPKGRVPPIRSKSSGGTPTSNPTPRHSNLEDPGSPLRRSKSEQVQSSSSLPRNGTKRSAADEKSTLILQRAILECQTCEDYISPYDDTNLLEQGIAAEQKLRMLRSLADGPQTEHLKEELEKIDDLATRMKHASMAPLLDILEKIERHMTEYFQSLAEQASESSFRGSMSPVKTSSANAKHSNLDKPPSSPRRTESRDHNEFDDEGTEEEGDGGALHRRSIPVNSDRASRSSPRSKSSRISKESRDKALHNVPSIGSQDPPKGGESDQRRVNGYRIHDDSASSGLAASRGHSRNSNGNDVSDHSSNQNRDYARGQLSDEEGSLDSAKGMHSDEEESFPPDQDEPLFDRDSASGSVSLGEPLRETYEMPLGGSYDESSRFGGGMSASYENSGRSRGVMSSDEERGDNEEAEEPYDEAEEDDSYKKHDREVSQAEHDLSDSESLDNSHESDHEEAPNDQEYDDDGSESLEDEREGHEDDADMGDEGSQSLKDGVKPSNGAMGDNDVLELSERGLINDDMSSVGRSMPGIYGSDSDSNSDDEGEYEDYDEDDPDGEYDDEDDDSESDKSEDSEGSDSNTESTPVKVAHEEIPNPKVEQFFDRLQHFFEVRRKIEERADLMDPSNKFRSLKVKSHSEGIEGRDGCFKEAYQQHDLRDRVVRNLDDLYDAAEPAQAELKRVLHQMVSEVKGMDSTSIKTAPLKKRDRAYEKAKQEYGDREPGPAESWLYDVVRSSVFCKSYKQMADVNKWLSKNVHIVSSKNRFAEPAFNGYRDLLFHVSIPYRGELAHICEIQVHHKDMKALDEQFGLPKHYEYFRSSFAGPWRSQDETLEDLALLNKEGEISGHVMKKLLKSKDPDQLRLVAGICREILMEFDKALELYRRVLIMQQDTHGTDHEDVASTYLSIGLVLGAMGETDESLENLQKALAIQESLLGSGHIKVAETQTEIGHMLIKKGDFSGALKEFRKAQQIRESKLGKEHLLVINSLQDIGRVLRELGEYKNSEAELRRALKIQEAVLGDVHNDVAATQAMIGTTLCQYGDFGKAMEMHRLALSIRETNLGKNHAATAESHTDIGIVLCQKGDFDVAEWRHRKALRIREAVLGKEDEACAISLIHLGTVLKRKGKFDDAINEIKRAQKIREQNLGMDNTVTAGSYLHLGNVYLEKKDYDEALKEFRRAKVIRESFLGHMHPDTALAYNCLGNALNLRGDHEAALVEHRKAIAIYENVLGKNHPKTAGGYQCIADALLAKGDRDAALIEHRKALSVRANGLAKDHPDTATSCARIGDLLFEKGDLVGASVAYRQALAITVGLCGEDHPDSAKAHIQVGKVLAAQGDYEEALEEVEQAANVLAGSLGKDHEQTGIAYSLLGTIYGLEDNHDEAVGMHQKAVAIFEKRFGKKSPESIEARRKLLLAENGEAPEL